MAKNYNMRALRGEDLNDQQAADIFKMKTGIEVPKDLLQTPKMNTYMIDKMYELNKTGLQDKVNPNTGLKYTVKEAEIAAKEGKMKAENTLKGLMRGK